MDEGADLIGIPFAYGARGPDAYDCYGLVMKMSRRNGVLLPDFGKHTDQAVIAAMMGTTLPLWREGPRKPGSVALIRIGRLYSHVGYVINDHQMIHAWEHSHGVTVANLNEWQHRIVGFYDYVG